MNKWCREHRHIDRRIREYPLLRALTANDDGLCILCGQVATKVQCPSGRHPIHIPPSWSSKSQIKLLLVSISAWRWALKNSIFQHCEIVPMYADQVDPCWSGRLRRSKPRGHCCYGSSVCYKRRGNDTVTADPSAYWTLYGCCELRKPNCSPYVSAKSTEISKSSISQHFHWG